MIKRFDSKSYAYKNKTQKFFKEKRGSNVKIKVLL